MSSGLSFALEEHDELAVTRRVERVSLSPIIIRLGRVRHSRRPASDHARHVGPLFGRVRRAELCSILPRTPTCSSSRAPSRASRSVTVRTEPLDSGGAFVGSDQTKRRGPSWIRATPRRTSCRGLWRRVASGLSIDRRRAVTAQDRPPFHHRVEQIWPARSRRRLCSARGNAGRRGHRVMIAASNTLDSQAVCCGSVLMGRRSRRY